MGSGDATTLSAPAVNGPRAEPSQRSMAAQPSGRTTREVSGATGNPECAPEPERARKLNAIYV